MLNLTNQKGVTPVLIVILMAALFGGYLIYSGRIDIKQQITTQNQTPTPTSAIPTTQQSDGSNKSINSSTKTGWKSYSDSNIGLSYRLPENDNWSVNTTDTYCKLKLERNNEDQYFCIRVFDNPKGLGRREFYCKYIAYNNASEESLQNCLNTGIKVSDSKVGNRDALYISEQGGQIDSAYVLNSNGKIIIISNHAVLFPKTPLPSGFDWNKLKDEILSTFWFN